MTPNPYVSSDARDTDFTMKILDVDPDGSGLNLLKDVPFTDDLLIADLFDGRTISVPLAWSPRLLRATPEEGSRASESRAAIRNLFLTFASETESTTVSDRQ